MTARKDFGPKAVRLTNSKSGTAKGHNLRTRGKLMRGGGAGTKDDMATCRIRQQNTSTHLSTPGNRHN